jgi:hypothetical protein
MRDLAGSNAKDNDDEGHHNDHHEEAVGNRNRTNHKERFRSKFDMGFLHAV